MDIYKADNGSHAGMAVDALKTLLPQDNAIQSLLDAKLAGKYSYLAANVVNHPTTSWIHAQIGAMRVRRCRKPGVAACPCVAKPRSLASSQQTIPAAMCSRAALAAARPTASSQVTHAACWSLPP